MACWINRSTTVGIPSSRSPPPGFGILTRRTGCGPIRAIEQGLPDRRPVVARVGREVLDAHPVNAGRTSIGLHLPPRAAHVVRRQRSASIRSSCKAGCVSPTPRLGSPGRVRRHSRVAHRSSLSVRVRPFAVPSSRARLLRPLLTSVRSRRALLRGALCSPCARSLPASLARSAASRAPGPWSTSGPSGSTASTHTATSDRSPRIRT